MFKETEQYKRFKIDAIESVNHMIEEFKEYQELALQTLQEIHRVCEKNDIEYFLAYGSLLGAIRDGGQIPWDYDIDIWIRGDQIEKLIEAFNKDLSKEYYFVSRYVDKSHRHFFMRVAPKGFSTEILHVDVFWLWNAGNNYQNAKRRTKLLDIYRDIAYWKNCELKYITIGMSNGLKKISKIKKNICKLVPNWILDKIYFLLVKRNIGESVFLSDEYMVFDKNDFSSVKKITLNDGNEYYVPKGFNAILKSLYGDYMNYLSIEGRLRELFKSLHSLRVGAMEKKN